MPAPSRFPADFSVSAAYPLFDYDPQQDRGWILHFTPQDYRRASFLDERALGHRQVPGWTLDRSELPGLLPDSSVRPTLHWLFHIGHCGSTLTSRLLDLVPGVLGLREPLPLLRLAGSPPAAQNPWFMPVLRMLARRFADTQAVIVKPTSVVTVSARSLLDHSAGLAQRIESSGVLHRYAKDERHAFDAETRHGEIGEANRRHHDDIQRGLSWAEDALAASAHPELAARLRP